ncbi:MAG TPA: PIN domain-containing protein [Tepidisphaeraceae bacterium]|jgi:predicted nucleic acid-binding protein|nr:PIN domain-containing protein [Tepidisphaeraceae bacterium]
MILLDTSVLVRYLRTADPKILAVLSAPGVAVSVVTRAEILHGAKNEPDFRRLDKMLDGFSQVGAAPEAWTDLARNLYELRLNGVMVPFPDALIATLAIRESMELWTLDNHFQLIQGVLPSLKLFRPPP